MMSNDFVWQGDKEMRLDDPYVFNFQDVIIGVYGGNTSSGANKNEDGALVWRAPDSSWEFIVVLDAHNSSQSVDIVIKSLQSIENKIKECLSSSSNNVFERV